MQDTELNPPYELLEPAGAAIPFLFNLPHSGNIYPERFVSRARLDALRLRRSEDAFVDELFAGVVDQGATLLRARFPRAYVDVNREPYELDPTMFDGPLPAFANTRSVRVAGGLGTIPRIVAEAEEIYAERLPVAEALGRIAFLYKPYHRALRSRLEALRARFGVAVLIDCHSMPSLKREEPRRPDIVLGDRFGTSCAGLVIDLAQECFQRLGYAVVRNKPYAGGYITETYGRPADGLHALQIEVNRGLYMDEDRYVRLPRFPLIADDLMRVSQEIMSLSPRDLAVSAAAE